ncbi:MAG: DUF6048 family protein [Paludibacteraceae bacterium]|nr:DUF6048 family protein [Paludibacteraceae bacterium]
MLKKLLIIIIVVGMLPIGVSAKENIAKNDSTHTHAHHAKGIYQGTNIKLDLGATALTLGTTKAHLQHYEIAVNCRLKNRFYPTLEVGYAGSLPATSNDPMRGTITLGDSIAYRGQGGFFRVGCDINPLKKHPESPHALLIGVRLGTSIQSAQHTLLNTQYSILTTTSADCWGEIVAGCQVEVCKGFTMGWMGRFKCLFTRQAEGLPASEYKPIYIPGFGKRDNIAWGLDYYIGVSF